VAVMVMAMMMVTLPGSECRAGANQQQKSGDDKLLHTLQRSTILL